MPPEAFRAAAHIVVDRIADYLRDLEQYPILPPIEPGSLRPLFPDTAPETPEALARILDDVDRLVFPNATHWQHPGFLAYFATTASGAGMLGEFLTAALGQNPMLWRTSPVGTELEGVGVGWLPQAVGLPPGVGGLLTGTGTGVRTGRVGACRRYVGCACPARGPQRFGGMLQRRGQHLRPHRLRDVVVHARGEAHLAVAAHRVRGHRDDLEVAVGPLRTD